MKYLYPEQPIFEMYTVDVVAGLAELVGDIAASAIVSSKITQELGKGGSLELKIKKKSLWLDLYNNIKVRPVFLARVIDGDIVNIYYLNDPEYHLKNSDGKVEEEYLIRGSDFSAWYLDTKQIENNVYEDNIPEQDTPDAYKFNKFDTVNKGIAYHIEDIFSNMLPNTKVPLIAATGAHCPRDRLKGRSSFKNDPMRQVAEMGEFDYSEIETSSNGIYVRLKKGRSMLNMLNYVMDAFYKKGEDFAGRQRAAYNEDTSKVDFTLYAPVTHEIDAKVSQKLITEYDYKLQTSTQLNDVLVESSNELDFYSKRVLDFYDELSTTRELWMENPPDDDPNAASLSTTANNALIDNAKNEIVTFDIDFKNFDFWINLNEGDKLHLFNFADIWQGLNGVYKIYSFTEIIEGLSVSYTVDEMRKEGATNERNKL